MKSLKIALLTAVVALVLALVLAILFVAFNFSAFYEGYCNGFYEMQTPAETVAAWLGNISFHILPFWKV